MSLSKPDIKRKTFISWNNKMFLKYNNIRMYNHSNPVIRYTESKRVNLILSFIGLNDGRNRILDLGCGEGYIINRINRSFNIHNNLLLVAGDISVKAISMGRDLNLIQQKDHPILLDAENIPFKNERFDYIVCTELLEHTVSPNTVLKEIERVLKPNGIAIITVPNEPLINKIKLLFLKLNIFETFLKDVPKDMTKEWHLHSFDLNVLKNVIMKENISLKIIKVEATPFSFLPVRYILKCCRKGV